MKTLEFLTPSFHGGFNTTVRKGTKWADLVSGEEIELVGAAGEKMGVATVVFAKTLHARQDQQAILAYCEFNHDPTCKTWGGLVQAMNKAYQESGGWGPEVTVVGFMLPNRITLGESNVEKEIETEALVDQANEVRDQVEAETPNPDDPGTDRDVWNPPADNTAAGENPNVEPLTTGGADVQVTFDAPVPMDDPEKTA